MKPQDRERAHLVYPRAEVLLPALDALVVAAGLIALRPALEVQASGHAPDLLLADAYALTWTLAGFLFGLTFLLGCHRTRHYDRRRPRWHEIGDIVGFALLLGSIDLGLSLIGGIDPRIPVGVWLLLAVLVPLGRAGLRRRLDALGLWRRPTVVVGVGDNAERAAQALMREPGLGLAIVAFADPTEGRLLAGGGIRPVPRMISLGDELRPVLPLDRLLGEITSNLAAPHMSSRRMPTRCRPASSCSRASPPPDATSTSSRHSGGCRWRLPSSPG
jgi:hypothetical protein